MSLPAPDHTLKLSPRLAAILPWAIFLLAVIARLLPGARTIDDSYITYRYARDILAGQGFVFNPGERVLGTTTPLYTALMVSGRRAERWDTGALPANCLAAQRLCRWGRLPVVAAHRQALRLPVCWRWRGAGLGDSPVQRDLRYRRSGDQPVCPLVGRNSLRPSGKPPLPDHVAGRPGSAHPARRLDLHWSAGA